MKYKLVNHVLIQVGNPNPWNLAHISFLWNSHLIFNVRNFAVRLAHSYSLFRSLKDNYGTHKHSRVQSWLKRHPRFHLHFIHTSSSWLNLVERWFREIIDKRIRRGSFKNVPSLVTAIQDYIDAYNQNPKVFIWSASVEKIMTKIAKSKEALETLR